MGQQVQSRTFSRRPWLLGVGALVCADLCMAFLWVFLNAVLRVLVDVSTDGANYSRHQQQLIKRSIVVGLLFLFYGLSKATGGATYNPLTVVAYAVANITPSYNNINPLYLVSFRIPAQIVGAVWGASIATACMPETYRSLMKGPSLQSSPHIGALVEGTLTFVVVFIILIAVVRGPKSGIRRTWITSLSRVSLSILGAEYTGPAMNPANAFGWAFLKNQHNTWEHLYVYWVSPFLGTLAAAWIVRATFVRVKTTKEKQN